MHNQLEKYLSQIEKQLSALTVEQRQDELREIRSHLEMMIEDNVARGCDADIAVANALEQFGASDKVGRDLKHVPNSEFKRKRALYISSFALITLMFLVSPGLYILTMNRFHFTSHAAIDITFYSLVIVAFIAGWTLEGFRAPAKKIVLKKTIMSFIKRYAALCVYIIWIVIDRQGNVFAPEFIIPISAFLVGMWLRRRQMKTRAAALN